MIAELGTKLQDCKSLIHPSNISVYRSEVANIFLISTIVIRDMDVIEADDDDLLYGDLEDSGRSADHVKLAAKVVELTKKNDLLISELIETKHQLQVITEEKSVVENNLMILYNTALREIGRKDKQIGELMSNDRLGASTINKTVRKSHS